MKSSIAAAVMLTFSLSTVSAQSDNQRPDGRKPPRPDHQLEALGLSQTQEQEVHLIIQSHREEMRELRREGASCEDQQVLRAQFDGALGEVLSEDQLTRFQDQKLRGKPPGKRRGRGGDSCDSEVSQ